MGQGHAKSRTYRREQAIGEWHQVLVSTITLSIIRDERHIILGIMSDKLMIWGMCTAQRSCDWQTTASDHAGISCISVCLPQPLFEVHTSSLYSLVTLMPEFTNLHLFFVHNHHFVRVWEKRAEFVGALCACRMASFLMLHEHASAH